MIDEFKNWNPTCNRFVAFLDIMGFRDRVFREDHDKVKEMLESLRPAIKIIEDEIKKPDLRRLLKSQSKDETISPSSIIYPVTFSDSIILISNDDSDISAFYMLGFVIFVLIIAFEKAIPMKGAIACGKMTADTHESLYFGKPLIDAFELQQELQLYGVVLHHTCEKHINDPNFFKDPSLKGSRDNGIIKYLAPMKSGKITHYIVNWVYTYKNEKVPIFKEKNPINAISNLYNSVSGKPRLYVDNTLDFVRWVKEKEVELEQKEIKKKNHFRA
jgi:hypothetical protein